MMKIKIIEMKNTSLIGESYRLEHLFINGEKPLETFKYGWIKINGKVKKIQDKVTKKKNERWELKNKELYNETIPLLIDNYSQEKYKALVESDLYEHKYETYEELEDVEFEIEEKIVLKDEILFETKTGYKTYSWSRGWEEPYLINECTYSFTDQCFVQSPLLELTCPVMLKRNSVFKIVKTIVTQIVNYDKISIKENSDYILNIMDFKQKYTILKLDNWENINCKNPMPNIFAKNINELQEKLKYMAYKIKDYVENEYKYSWCEYIANFDEDFLKMKEKTSEK